MGVHRVQNCSVHLKPYPLTLNPNLYGVLQYLGLSKVGRRLKKVQFGSLELDLSTQLATPKTYTNPKSLYWDPG